jgi:hypothetical protein
MKIITKNIKESLAEKFPFIRKLRFYHYIAIWILLSLIPYIIFYIYTFPLRSKESYSRNVVVDFIYKGESYKISANTKCINHGIVNDLTGPMHIDWRYSVDRKDVLLQDGTMSRLVISDFFIDEAAIDNIFDRTNTYVSPFNNEVLCRILLPATQDELNSVMKKSREYKVKKIRRVFKNKDLSKFNIDFGLIEISDAEQDDNNHKLNPIGAKITNVFFEEKKIIKSYKKSYKKYLPFFLSPDFYFHPGSGPLPLIIIVICLTIIPPLMILLIVSPVITLFINLVSGFTSFFTNFFK